MNKEAARVKIEQCRKSFEDHFGIAPKDEEIEIILENSIQEKKMSWLENFLTDRSPKDLHTMLSVHRKEEDIDSKSIADTLKGEEMLANEPICFEDIQKPLHSAVVEVPKESLENPEDAKEIAEAIEEQKKEHIEKTKEKVSKALSSKKK